MSHLKIGLGNSMSINSTGQAASMKAAAYLQTSDIANAPLAVEQWHLGGAKYYQKRSCLRPYLLGYKRNNLPKCCLARPDPNLPLPYMRDWYVQAGTSGLATTDDKNRGAFMLGGTGSDKISSGGGDDFITARRGGDDVLDTGKAMNDSAWRIAA